MAMEDWCKLQNCMEDRKSLSMAMIDYDYNGEYFDMRDREFASDLEKDNYEIRFPAEKLIDRMMIIYMDLGMKGGDKSK